MYNAAGSTNVVLDANGWFGSGTAQPGAQYQAITPTRICDTRSKSGLPCAGKPLGPAGIDSVVVAGEAGLPASNRKLPGCCCHRQPHGDHSHRSDVPDDLPGEPERPFGVGHQSPRAGR